jgi:hypothetical protein
MEAPPCIEAALKHEDLSIDELRAVISFYQSRNLSKEIELLLKGIYKDKFEKAKQLTLKETKFTCSALSRFCDGTCTLSDFQRVINEIEEATLLKRSGVIVVKLRGETWTAELDKLFTDSGRVTMKDFIVWYAKTFGRTIQLVRVNRRDEQIDQHKDLLDYILSIAEKVDDASDVEMVAEQVLNRICSTYAEKFDGKNASDVMYNDQELYVSSKFIEFELRRLKTSVTMKKLAGFLSSRGLREKKTRLIRCGDQVARYWVFNINALKAYGYTPLLAEEEEEEVEEEEVEDVDFDLEGLLS